MQDKHKVASIGIVCITALGITAVLTGHDSGVITATAGLIGTLVGYCFGSLKREK